MEENKIYICLENGNVFEGKSFGAKGEVIGELWKKSTLWLRMMRTDDFNSSKGQRYKSSFVS